MWISVYSLGLNSWQSSASASQVLRLEQHTTRPGFLSVCSLFPPFLKFFCLLEAGSHLLIPLCISAFLSLHLSALALPSVSPSVSVSLPHRLPVIPTWPWPGLACWC